MWWIYAIIVAVSILCGAFAGYIFGPNRDPDDYRDAGTLLVVTGEEEKPTVYLQVRTNPDELKDNEKVIMTVWKMEAKARRN